ncbi:hypothetical protein Tco_1364894 [Tanacetum coccineum]
MHTTNFDHLYEHLRQHEAHANEVCLARQRYPDQIALVANSLSCLNPTQYYPQLSFTSQQSYPSPAPQRSYDAPIVQQSQYQPQVVTYSQVLQQQPYQALTLQQSYQATVIHQPMQPSFLELDLGLVVLSFNLSDDPIASLNKAVAFLSTTFALCLPQTNNQLRTSSKPRNQATIQDRRFTVQTVQGRQTQGYANNRARNTTTNPEQLIFLAYNRDTIIPAQASQEIPTPAAFQTDDLDAFDSDYDDVPSNKAVLT